MSPVSFAAPATDEIGLLIVLTDRPRTGAQSDASNTREDPGYDVVCRLVLPSANHGPARVAEHSISLCVALSVPGHLLCPELGVRLRDGVVRRAPMPEAPVHEHGHLRASEHQVGPAVSAWERPVIDAIPKSDCMSRASDSHLRLRVAPAVRLHATSDPRGGRP